ncbi:MAG: DUF938 domain-containing protein [Gammaproteobacteria bacterium]|nr:DUF938 domain-containing protein [Gammaproteobacteria bacterium]
MEPSCLPFSQACENNKSPILDILRLLLAGSASVLEIGSGTGQHGAFFASQLPKVRWQCSDVEENLESLNIRLKETALGNLPTAITLDVNRHPWNCSQFDTIFTANSFHIMSIKSVEAFFCELPHHIKERGQLVVYGPFRYGGDYTSESNARFDQWLKDRDPDSGIRDFERISALAQGCGMELQADHAMPANNQLLVWQQATQSGY